MLVTCPDCGKEISDAAPACPNCGRPSASRSRIPLGIASYLSKRFNQLESAYENVVLTSIVISFCIMLLNIVLPFAHSSRSLRRGGHFVYWSDLASVGFGNWIGMLVAVEEVIAVIGLGVFLYLGSSYSRRHAKLNGGEDAASGQCSFNARPAYRMARLCLLSIIVFGSTFAINATYILIWIWKWNSRGGDNFISPFVLAFLSLIPMCMSAWWLLVARLAIRAQYPLTASHLRETEWLSERYGSEL